MNARGKGLTRVQSITATIIVRRPDVEVFAFVTDTRNNSLWRSTANPLEMSLPPPDGPVGVGAQITETWRFMGMSTRATDEVTEYEPTRRYTRRLLTGSCPVIQETFEFQPVANGTRWIIAALVQANGECPVAEPILATQVRQAIAASMATAKRLLERRVVDIAR